MSMAMSVENMPVQEEDHAHANLPWYSNQDNGIGALDSESGTWLEPLAEDDTPSVSQFIWTDEDLQQLGLLNASLAPQVDTDEDPVPHGHLPDALPYEIQEANEALEQVFESPTMPELEDNTHYDWLPPYTSTTTDLVVWDPTDDPPPPILLPENAGQPLDTQIQTAPSEAVTEDAAFTLVGDPESQETLPSATDLFADPPTVPLVTPSPAYTYLRSVNPTMESTFRLWRKRWEERSPHYPEISDWAPSTDIRSIHKPSHLPKRHPKITSREMSKNECDKQGIYWSRYGVTPTQAREVRRLNYLNYTNMHHPATHRHEDIGTPRFKIKFSSEMIPDIPNTERHFQHRATYTNCKPLWRHYQLRHNVFAASQNAIYYHTFPSQPYIDPVSNLLNPSPGWSISCYNPNAGNTIPVMEQRRIRDPDVILDGVSTLSASHNILVVGSIHGVYGLRSLLTSPTSPSIVGAICSHTPTVQDNSTNHVYTHLSRASSIPLAAFSSNDRYIRTLDTMTNTWLSSHRFNTAVNCAASSPCTRLRLLVSDDTEPLVVDAETGEILYTLTGHLDHGFACAWSEDGRTLATAHQDGLIQLYDVRNLATAIKQLPADMACVRSLQFSPLGSGPTVLVAAEPADFVHVISEDGGNWGKKQSIEFWGDVSGVSLDPQGRSLWIGCADPAFGGLMEYERTSWGGFRGSDREMSKDDDDEAVGGYTRDDDLLRGQTERFSRAEGKAVRNEYQQGIREREWSLKTERDGLRNELGELVIGS